MSKQVKELIRNELVKELQGLSSLAVVDFTGVDAVTTNRIRSRLLAKDIRVMVVKNSLVRQAFKQVGMEAAGAMIEGPSAIAYGPADKDISAVTIVRAILEIVKDAPKLTVKAALLDGEIFRSDRVEALSRYPTRQEAIAKLVQVVLSPGGKLSACLLGPGGRLASLVKAIEEKHKASEAPAEEPQAA